MEKTKKRNASSYCNYNDSFISYDHNRQPNGLQDIYTFLKKLGYLLKNK